MSFKRFFLVRLGWALFGLWLAVTIVFVSTRVIVEVPLVRGPPAEVERNRVFFAEFDRDEPIHERYVHFFRRLVTDGSPGRSLLDQRYTAHGLDAGHIARHALPATLSLVAGAILLALAIGAVVGVAWSRAPPGWDRVIRVPIYVAVGLSPIFVGALLSVPLGLRWGFLSPLGGYCDFFAPARVSCGGARDWLSHLAVPVATLSLFFAAIYSRILRSCLADIARVPKGEERRRLRRRLVLVFARIAGRDFGWALGVALLVEVGLGVPGLGRTLIQALDQFDFVVVEAVVLYAALLAIGVHFVVDVIVGALDRDLRAEWPVAGMPKPT